MVLPTSFRDIVEERGTIVTPLGIRDQSIYLRKSGFPAWMSLHMQAPAVYVGSHSKGGSQIRVIHTAAWYQSRARGKGIAMTPISLYEDLPTRHGSVKADSSRCPFKNAEPCLMNNEDANRHSGQLCMIHAAGSGWKSGRRFACKLPKPFVHMSLSFRTRRPFQEPFTFRVRDS